MRDEEFNLSISLTKKARGGNGICAGPPLVLLSILQRKATQLESFDYCLFKPTAGYCHRVEQTDDHFTSSMDSGTFFVELGIYKKKNDKTITNGKLKVTKADYYLIVLNNLKKVVLLNVVNLKNLIMLTRREAEDLQIYEPQGL